MATPDPVQQAHAALEAAMTVASQQAMRRRSGGSLSTAEVMALTPQGVPGPLLLWGLVQVAGLCLGELANAHPEPRTLAQTIMEFNLDVLDPAIAEWLRGAEATDDD